VGEALEELFPDRLDEFSGLMAYHFEAANAYEKAVNYLQRAGDQARLVYAHQEAIDFFERALVILKGQNEYDRAARTLMKLGLTYHTAFDFQRSRQAYDEAFAMRQRDWAKRPETLEPAPHPFKLLSLYPATLDPTTAFDSTSTIYIPNVFSGLMAYGTGWEIIPDVARSWEISEDGRRYVFHLRDDVYWSDGKQVTAEDFAYSWKRTLDPATKANIGKAGVLYVIKNARAYNKNEISDPTKVGVRAIDELTLEVKLERAASYFLHALADLFPVPRHIVEDHGESWTDQEHIVTNGAFQIVSCEPGKIISLERNPTYHGRFSGNLDKVEAQLGKSIYSPEVLKLYETDSIDVVRIYEATYHARHKYAEDFVSYPLTTVYFIGFDPSRPPFDDLRVRRAFVMAVDRVRAADVLLDGFKYPATGGFVPPTIPGHSPGIGLPYDPDQARQLMAQAGYPDGQGFPSLEIVWSNPDTALEYLKSQWFDKLNVKVEIKIVNWENVLSTNTSRNVSYMGFNADYPDPDSFLRVGVRSQFPLWQNDIFDQLLEEAERTLNQEERIRLYKEADKHLIEDAVIMPITYSKFHILQKPWIKLPVEYAEIKYWKDVIIEPH
jgi:oligopeptide transport system substrate-binding protein